MSLFSQSPLGQQSSFGQKTSQPSPFGGQPSLFGQQSTQQSTFGQQTTSPFGQQTTSPFGQQTTSPFGQQTTSPFGQQTTSPFGQQTTSIFGQQPSQQASFNSTQQSPFGQQTTQQSRFGILCPPSPLGQNPSQTGFSSMALHMPIPKEIFEDRTLRIQDGYDWLIEQKKILQEMSPLPSTGESLDVAVARYEGSIAQTDSFMKEVNSSLDTLTSKTAHLTNYYPNLHECTDALGDCSPQNRTFSQSLDVIATDLGNSLINHQRALSQEVSDMKKSAEAIQAKPIQRPDLAREMLHRVEGQCKRRANLLSSYAKLVTSKNL